MKTKYLMTITAVVIGLFLYGCSAANSPSSSANGIQPTPTPQPIQPSNTPVPAMPGTPTPGIPSAIVDITIKDFAFDPPTMTIKAGTAVRWTNQDSAPHSISSDDGLWASNSFSKGESYTFVFDKPGTYAYHCGVHPTMKGTIIVTS